MKFNLLLTTFLIFSILLTYIHNKENPKTMLKAKRQDSLERPLEAIPTPNVVEVHQEADSIETALPQVVGPTEIPVETPVVDIPISPLPTPVLAQVAPIPVVATNTLIEMPVEYSTNINYFYPYFYKAHLITLANDIDVTVLQTVCNSPNCGFCDSTGVCMRCDTGFFLYGNSCILFCPEGHIADNLRMLCVEQPSRVAVQEVISTKAYSVGSCKNKCGSYVEDCSCTINCKANGNCCTDYDDIGCRNIFQKARQVEELCKLNKGCQYCDGDKKAETVWCNQCKDNFYILNGECYETCPVDFLTDNTNNLCYPKPDCIVSDCDTCSPNSNSQCVKCKRGTFMFNNQCVGECPVNYNADRITWTCLETPVFAWYWIYPSRTSCKTNCGVVIQEDWDCSCSPECFRFGNCCQDIEDYCPSLIYWRKAPALRKDSKNNNDKKAKEVKNIVLNPKLKHIVPKMKITNVKVEKKEEKKLEKKEIKEEKKAVKVEEKKDQNTLIKSNKIKQ